MHECYSSNVERKTSMASFNRVIMIGNLTRDPDYKKFDSSGQGVCNLGLASNRQFKNRQTGQTTQEVCFIDVEVWGAQAESCKQHLKKGRLVLVEGRIKLSSWEDDQGQRKSKHSIVADRVTFLSQNQTEEPEMETEEMSSAVETRVRPAASSAPKKATRSSAPSSPSGEISFSDQKPFEDDLPF